MTQMPMKLSLIPIDNSSLFVPRVTSEFLYNNSLDTPRYFPIFDAFRINFFYEEEP